MVSAQALKVYRVLRERDMTTPINFRTASGEQVSIERECMLEVFFPTMIEHEDGEKVKVVRYEIRAVIGPVEHSLLSVHGLTRMGATFTFGPNSCSIQIADIRRMSCEIWANVPWVRAHRRRGKDRKGDVDMEEAQVFEAWSDQSPSSQGGKSPSQSSISSPSKDTTYRTSSSAISFFGTTSKSTHTGHAKVLQFDDEPEIHEFEPNTMSSKPSKLHESWPNALICAGSISDDHPLPALGDVDEPMDPVPKEDHAPDSAQIQAAEPASYQQLSRKIEKELVLHRRRGHIPFDSRCDHCVRSRSVVRHSRSHPGRSPIDHKLLLVQADFMFLEGCRFLVLADAGTGLVGVAAVDGHTDRTQSDCLAFFKQLAVTEASPVVVEVLTDSDAMLGNLLRRLGLPLQVKTAGRQAHETVGLAERNVRRFKEMVSCLRSDLRAHRFDLTCSGECLRFALNYVAQTHNHFGAGSTSGYSEHP